MMAAALKRTSARISGFFFRFQKLLQLPAWLFQQSLYLLWKRGQ
jgi:hypothetical protein